MRKKLKKQADTIYRKIYNRKHEIVEERLDEVKDALTHLKNEVRNYPVSSGLATPATNNELDYIDQLIDNVFTEARRKGIEM